MPSSAWNIDVIRSREAMTRVAQVLGPTADWAGILVAHMDTGFTDHVVFNLAGTNPAIRIADGRNFMDPGETEPRDPLTYSGGLLTQAGHGTRTLGALCGNLPGTYVGVCPTVPVVPYRVTNGVVLMGDTILNLASAIMDAVDRNLADVISISLGVQSVFGNVKQMHVLGRAVDHAYERGVIICGAAGQTEGAPQLVGATVYPGRYSRCILVGGINSEREICFDYDSGRNDVDVWAPADDVSRPNPMLGLAPPFTEIGTGDGTSYATVHAAGAAAMWLRVRGEELHKGGYSGWQRVEAFRACLRSSFSPLAGNDVPPKRKVPTGSGILDCVRLLDGKIPDLKDLKKAALAEPQTG